MICTRLNDKDLIRYNYTFLNEGKDVRVWNNDYEKIIPYDRWINEYYIVDKWKTV